MSSALLPIAHTSLAAAVAALTSGKTACDPWVLRTSALEAAGYLPGDVVVVDLNARAAAGDIVCAQSYDWGKGEAETIWRVYEPPYLLAAPLDPELADKLRRPLVVDSDRVIIKGVVTAMLRSARSDGDD